MEAFSGTGTGTGTGTISNTGTVSRPLIIVLSFISSVAYYLGMKIAIAQRFRPFSHTPGASALIPGEEKLVSFWPGKSVIKNFEGLVLSEGTGGPTLTQDLETPFRPERLSFGNHKQQDVDLIRRRKDLSEILPIWFKLASFYPNKHEVKPGSLLYELIHQEDRNKLADLFLKCYLSGFSSFFVPRAQDADFNGFELPPLTDEPLLALVTEGARAIKNMIVEERDKTLFIMPRVPPLFSAGRIVETAAGEGVISIEWTKHFIRQVIYTPKAALDALDEESELEPEFELRFPKEVKGYRVRSIGKSFHFDNFMA